MMLSMLLAVISAPAGAASPEHTDEEGVPPRDYLILVNYDLGMHCTGFDFTYCCVLPPYNSILAQVVKTERHSDSPMLLGADPADPTVVVDGDRRFRLAYTHEDPDGVPNTYSATKKLAYWGVGYKGRMLPDYEFSSLYIYEDLHGSNPEHTSADKKKRHVGLDTVIKLNQGPTGAPVSGGYLRYSGEKGTVVYADSPAMENVPVQLSNPGIWEALGLPLTPFNDRFTALISLDESMVQPYQRSVVTLVDAETEEPVVDSSGEVVRFFGVNPIDVPNCARCHASERANGARYQKYREEYHYWRDVRRSSEWYARLKAAAISILEIHDARNGTNFLANWPAGPDAYKRLGRDAVMCQACHADNVIGRLQSRRADEMAAEDVQPDSTALPPPDHLISPLSEAIHKVHQYEAPLPDKEGFASGCQLCHPAHRSNRSMSDFPLTRAGHNRFSGRDIRDSKGCFTGRDVHANIDRNTDGVETGSHLNDIGRYLLLNVMNTDDGEKGLYCTNCHNMLSRELYKADHLTNAERQTGTTLRNRSLREIANALDVSLDELLNTYLDPRSPAQGKDSASGVYRTWSRDGQAVASIARIRVDSEGKPVLTPPDEDGDRSVIIVDTDPEGEAGMAVSYDAATHGRDYWLSPGEPHCADCHQAPFVESMGGGAFPIDQPGKYALMRYSRGHAQITCQGCHESTHGLYPVNPGVDVSSYQQAAMLNPDASHGPIKCGACHQVNEYGVPTAHQDIIAPDSSSWKDYDKSVVLQHLLR